MDHKTEDWRDIAGYEGVYKVSSLGHVKRIAQGRGAVPGRILRPYSGKRRYAVVVLSKNCLPKTCSVHRLVAGAFHGPCPHGHEVNHKNGDPHDNRAENLEWITHAANQCHSVQILGNNTGERHPMAQLTKSEVLQIRQLYATGTVSMSCLARRFSVSSANIWFIVHRKTWRHI